MTLAVAVAPVLVAGLVAPAAAAPATATATEQLNWVVDASHRVPVSDTELAAHLSADALSEAGGPDAVNKALKQVGSLRVDKTLRTTGSRVQALLSGSATYLTTVSVDDAGLIATMAFGAYRPTPGSWSTLDDTLATLAPHASFASAEIDRHGNCRLVHGVQANTQRPLGSAFKLYVLGALGHAVAGHRASWNEKLAIHQAWKSLPSGQLQDKPAGTKLTLGQYADYMISISDNTAADHLVHRLGQPAVEAELHRLGNAHPSASKPFLTTRELFALKGHDYPDTADRYLALPRPLRRLLLPALDRVPRNDIDVWSKPRKAEQLEWFGSPTDMCRAFAGLWRQHQRPGMAPLGNALSINDGGIGLDRKQYPQVWFKGGSEPGVLTLNYLARSSDGRLLVSSVMLTDPGHALDSATVTPAALALARGGIELADR